MLTARRTQMIVLTGLCVALVVVGALISVPFGPVPFTLQTLMVGMVVCLLPGYYGVFAIGAYLVLGAFGLPVFAGMRGGLGVLVGPTGGFLMGFLVAALLVAFVRSRLLPNFARNHSLLNFVRSRFLPNRQTEEADGCLSKQTGGGKGAPAARHQFSFPLNPVADVCSLVVLLLVQYALGCLWFTVVVPGVGLEAAFSACVAPFLLPDILKACAAFLCVQPVRAALRVGSVVSYTK